MEKPTHLKPGHCALLVIDIQEKLMPVIYEKEEVIKNAALLMKAANIMNIPIVATTQYAARIGELLPSIKEELGDAKPLDKLEFDCFANSRFPDRLIEISSEIDTLLICGVETHICIYQTVVGALRSGYKVWIPADAVSSRQVKNYQTGLARIETIGGIIGNTEMIIYDLLGQAGTPEFKEILPFVK